MIVNNWYVFFDFQNWRDCSSEHDWDGGKVLHQRTAVFIQQKRKGIFTLFMQGKNRAILQ